MNILVICHEFPPLGGGAGANTYRLCQELQKKGHQIQVFTSASELEERPPYEFKVKYFQTGRRAKLETNVVSLILFILKTLLHGKRLLSSKPDLILSIMAIPAGIPGTILSKQLKIPGFIWHHGSDVHGGSTKGPRFLHKFILKKLWKHSYGNWFISPSQLRQAGKIASIKMADILPVSIEKPPVLEAMEKTISLLFLGRLEPVKNPTLFLEAVSRLRHQNILDEHKVRIAGNGSLKHSLQTKIRTMGLEDTVSLSTPEGRKEVWKLYAQSDILVLPSTVEGFGMVILEAGLFNIPSVGSRVPGIEDAIEHEKTGLLFEPGNITDLCQKISRLLKNHNERIILGKNANEKAKQFISGKNAETFGKLIKKSGVLIE